MNLPQLVTDFFNDIAGQASIAILLVGVLDFFLGIFAAFRDKTFTLAAIDAWLRSNLAGRILPLWFLLFAGYLANGIQFAGLPVITSIGIGGAVVYVGATLAAIAAKWNPNAANRTVQGVPTD
jgi:hypothetical protein